MSIKQEPAMTPQQRQFVAGKHSPFITYKHIIVGEKSWLYFILFELYRLLFTNIESIFGIGLRRLFLPLFLKKCGKGLVVGNGVSIRQPNRIKFGKKIILDDYSLVNVRTKQDNNNSDAYVDLADYVYVGRYSIVSSKYGKVKLGAACNIGAYSRIATQGTIDIGKSTLIASYVYIGGGNHGMDSNKPIMEQEMELKGGVTIGENCWIGTKSTVVDGVKIGNNVIVGAHSLVREDIPDNAVVVGVPAKIIKYRDSNSESPTNFTD